MRLKRLLLFLLTLNSTASMALELKSTAFLNKQLIPAKYTCEGQNISPPLNWVGIPKGTKSFVLIMDDPDATSGVWDHWLVYNIPGEKHCFDEAENLQASLQQGKNSWGKNTYGGPCPPAGNHRYRFKLYALSDNLTAVPGVTKPELETLMQGKILSQTLLIGRYQKSQ